jgi:hypothetical protein
LFYDNLSFISCLKIQPMKKLIMGLFGVLLICQGLQAQGITRAEYFFDTDPGQGNGTVISFAKADSVNKTMTLSVSSLTPGFHSLFVRVLDSLNHWSLYEGRNFFVQPPVTLTAAAQIQAAEYFFDADPGQGLGTPVSLTLADSISKATAIPVTSLTPGFHSVFVRTQNTAGAWSLYEGRNFYVQKPVVLPPAAQITASEYFFDTDPGQGHGTAVATTLADSVSLSPSIGTASLTPGFHSVFVRSKNTDGVWSLYEGRNFYVQPPVVLPAAAQIQAAEYFIDADPGQGHGTAISLTVADSVNLTKNLVLTAIQPGFHSIFLRTQNTAGVWSLYEGRNFYYMSAPASSPISPKIVAAEYFFDTDPGVGKGFSVPGVVKADSISVTANLNASALVNGNHKAFVRVKDSLNVWSLYEGRAFKVKNCALSVSVSGTNPTCSAGTNGTATAVPFGGSAPYTYSWNTTPVQTTATAINLPAGTYSVTVSDSSACPAIGTVTINQPAGITLTTNVVNASCGQPNGQALVNANGGSTPYTYSWSTVPVQTSSAASGLAAGSYTATVKDANGCSANATVSITSTPALVLTVSSVPSNCGVAIGSASVTVSGGTTPYTYNWSNGSILTHADSLRSGIYIITVTDKNHCSTFAAATISDANGPAISVNLTPVSCAGQSSGSLTASVIGGASPYTYFWSNGGTGATISNLAAGPYQLTVKDAGGCVDVNTTTVTQPSPETLSVSTVNSGCGVSTGSATAAVSGGTTPYTYSWSSGANTASAVNLAAGVYLVRITDSKGCRDSAEASVSNSGGPVVTVGTVTNASCSTGINGSASITVSGGTPAYTYSWSNGSTTASVSNLAAGNYTVKVTDAGACVGTADVVVPETPPAGVSICEVTVDNATQKNLVMWSKSGASRIKSYNVYKESTYAGVYFLAGNVPYSKLSQFLDTLSNPQVRSWRYKISEIDSCGNESPMSASHKTMHLTVNQGLNNTVNLVWDNYEGLTFGTYYLYRDTTFANFTKIDSFPNTLFTYTDPSPPVAKHVYYRIGIANPTGCTPTEKVDASINYNSSKSNTGNHLEAPNTGILALEMELNSLLIYPNPSAGLFNLSLDLNRNRENIRIRVMNAMGQLISDESCGVVTGKVNRQINLSGMSAGIYFVQVQTNNSVASRRVVVQ